MLGIDVSKATLSATLVDPVSHRRQWELTVPHTPAGLRQLVQRTPASHPWVIEPTGRWSLAVAKAAQTAGRDVRLAPARRAKAFLAALPQRAKTDRLDRYGLALYGCATPLQPYPIKREAVDQLDQLLAARRSLNQAIMRLQQQAAELPTAAEYLRPALTDLRTRLKAIEAAIAARTAEPKQFPMAAELDRIPGVGPITAAAIASCLEGKAFAHPDAFVAYLGLDLRVKDSGQRRGQRVLSKRGNAELRRLLYLCAQASLRAKDSPFRAQYERERAKGLSTTAALCAVARKLAKVCWSLARYRATWDPARVYHQPTRTTKP